jgi:hypothetical protein
MAAVTEADAYAALLISMWSDLINIDTGVFTKGNNPSNEGFTSVVAGRNVYVHNFVRGANNTLSDYYQWNPNAYIGFDNFVFCGFLKPDFTQVSANHAFFYDSYNDGGADGFQFWFNSGVQDIITFMRSNGATSNDTTVGLTWNVDDIIPFCILIDKDAGLDSGNSVELYIDGVLEASNNVTWTTAGSQYNTTSKIGVIRNLAVGTNYGYDGGMYAWAWFNYQALAATNTDAEIVQFTKQNALGPGGSHLFPCELSALVLANQVRRFAQSGGIL